jgi:hypothetical protein
MPGTKNVVADTLSQLKHVSAITRSMNKNQTQESTTNDAHRNGNLQEKIPIKDITSVKTILIFTTPDLISVSPLTKEKHSENSSVCLHHFQMRRSS